MSSFARYSTLPREENRFTLGGASNTDYDSESDVSYDSDLDIESQQKYPSFEDVVSSTKKKTLQDQIQENMKSAQQSYSTKKVSSMRPMGSSINRNSSRVSSLNRKTSAPLPAVFNTEKISNSSAIGGNTYTNDFDALNQQMLNDKIKTAKIESYRQSMKQSQTPSLLKNQQFSVSPMTTSASNKMRTTSSSRLGTASSNKMRTTSSSRLGTASSNRLGTASSNRLGTASSNRLGTASSNRLGTASLNRTSSMRESSRNSSKSRSMILDVDSESDSEEYKYDSDVSKRVSEESFKLANHLNKHFDHIAEEKDRHRKTLVNIRLQACLSYLNQYKDLIVDTVAESCASCKQVIEGSNDRTKGKCAPHEKHLNDNIADFANKLRECVSDCTSVMTEVETVIRSNEEGLEVPFLTVNELENKVHNCVANLENRYREVNVKLMDSTRSLYECFSKF